MNEFGIWLTIQLEKRHMNQSDLARASNMKTVQVSRIINGKYGASQETLTAFANALRLPPNLLFEKAGFLPPKPEPSPIKRKLARLAENLPDSDVELAITILEQRHEYYRKNPKAKQVK